MEQDPDDFGGGLPTYNDLAEQNGPNSRFGRWKGWVEKRAAERYADESSESQRNRRKNDPWGPRVDIQIPERPSPPPPPPPPPSDFTISPSDSGLNRTQTVLSNPPPHADADPANLTLSLPITVGQALPPSHLRLHSFGSRFLPHSELPILSCLPLFDHQKLVLGHMDGLTVLDLAPEANISGLDSSEPRRRDIWQGEGVYQMEILELERPSSSNTPLGVVLALVGAELPESGSEKETTGPMKTIRMYNLASLASLVRWAAARKDNIPLDLSRPANWQSQHKKHKSHLSVSRGLMPFGSPAAQPAFSYSQPAPSAPPPPPKDFPRSSANSPSKSPTDRVDLTDSWDLIDEDIPLRWATDFVPLASPSSRLAGQSVLWFQLHKSTDGGRVTARLAVATKQNILLYETVRGERAFRFVKEFYTPIPARGVTFVSQNPPEPQAKAVSPSSSRSLSQRNSFALDKASRRISSPMPIRVPQTSSRTGQLSLFVIFEKKAGLIKISDSSVGEIELWDEPGHSRRLSSYSPISTGSLRRSLYSPETPVPSKDHKGPWAPPAEATLPLTRTMPRSPSFDVPLVPVYLLTRGKITHIVRSPLPMPLAAHAPLVVLTWGMRPSRVVPRMCEHPLSGAPFLQVTALGEDGVEVQELDLAFVQPKGKERATSPVVVQAEVGSGGAGFLCGGGHWTEALRPKMVRQESTNTVDTVSRDARHSREEGFYAWTQYAINDWRVFWLGGDADDGEVPPMSP